MENQKKIEKVLFMGSKNLGLEILKTMHKCAPESLVACLSFDDRKDERSCFEELESYSKKHQIDFIVAKNRMDSERTIQALDVDLCIVAGWYWLISKETLKSASSGFIGLHFSALPKLRGSSPIVWSILNGNSKASYSFFSLSEGMDEGDIWAQGGVDILETDDVSHVLSKLTQSSLDIFSTIYPQILAGELKAQPQTSDGATFCATRGPKDGKIDWTKTSEELFNFIRAQTRPYPGAFTNYQDHTVRIWKVSKFPHPYFGQPGQIVQKSDQGLLVVCGDNRALLVEDFSIDEHQGAEKELINSTKIRFS